MKILVVGSGGREHAITYLLHQQGHSIFSIPGNPGMEELSEPLDEAVDPYHFPELIQCAKRYHIDLALAGSETFLVHGMGDAFADAHIPFFGPLAGGALLESSKSLAKQFMQKYGIPTARFALFKSPQQALMECAHYYDLWQGIVVKSSGLAGGKGVTCCQSFQEALFAIQQKKADEEIVLEEPLKGREISLLAFCDGKQILPLLPAQDHKRIFDGDKGPNTGGVGAYAPVPFVTSQDMEQIRDKIIERTRFGLKQEGIDYKGVLYFGLMLTFDGPQLLEYNCRFGDPETQAILPLLTSDLGALMYACTNGTLSSCDLHWKQKASCCVVMTSGGYPNIYRTGEIIQGLEAASQLPETLIFHAGTGRNGNNDIVTAGGRVLGVTGLGDTLNKAIERAYQAAKLIKFNKVHYRYDIGYQSKTS